MPLPMQDRPLVSIILAAGSGTRMRSPERHKVCTPLAGRPVIEHALQVYARCGVKAHYIVVGAMADQVMLAASASPGTHVYCHQHEQRGTGHAARVAAEALEAVGYDGDVLVAAGDKVLEDVALRRLIRAFHDADADLAFLSGDVRDFPTAGRVVPGEDGRPVGIAEVFDIARVQLFQAMHRITRERLIPATEAEQMALAAFGRESKAVSALGGLWLAIRAGTSITRDLLDCHMAEGDTSLRVGGQSVSAEQLERVRQTNLSVYLFRATALYEALRRITSDNAQREEYLTDAVGILATMGRRIVAVPVEQATEAMAFNTPEEFQRIEEHLAAQREATLRETPRTTRSVSEWMAALDAPGAMISLEAVYGSGAADLESKRRLLQSALEAHGRRFGDGPVLIARAPGRLNIMGRHVDHQGGAGNLIAISRDTFAVMGTRDDAGVHLHSADPNQFPDRTFSVIEATTGIDGADWAAFVNGDDVQRRCAAARGDWGLYLQGVVARLQARSGRTSLRGFDATVAGDIPIAAGLSSSSALVVAMAEGIAEQNDLRLLPEEFVALCGEAEWYVGTRGGAGDHAAMKFGRRGRVVQFGSLPFGILGTEAFPEGHVFVVCDSHVKARKTGGARDVFNHRVACYHIGREMLKASRPDLAPNIEHLRDVNTRTLGITLPELADLLRSLPECLTRAEVRRALPDDVAELLLSTHSEDIGRYPIRSVVVFGVAECERSRSCAGLLHTGDLTGYGRWMNVSHDGDRVTRWDALGNACPFTAPYDDAAMAAWSAGAERGDPEAALCLQPGAYGCSTPMIDRMVDTALTVPGVLGAQISGAGLGGCMMALARREAAPELERALAARIYEPLGLEPRVFACTPVEGSGLVRL